MMQGMATSKRKERVPVTPRALVQRINRALAADDEELRKSRGMRAFLDLGHYYTIDKRQNFIARKEVDIEELGRSLNVLKPHEALADTKLNRVLSDAELETLAEGEPEQVQATVARILRAPVSQVRKPDDGHRRAIRITAEKAQRARLGDDSTAYGIWAADDAVWTFMEGLSK
jgi:hypothetical protein